ncbi:hypothetical protein J2X31_002785 [Flavobacterium arsenatis]|uniref:Polysaccharide chain length determinant N-terminal domain-containing protein n=1 Tax=Flavobacterium arsenatis TaxID=1484332 RepID=A0ABU1TSC3_9FLAO|nr:hypothetical protein [Flavobacterium arsenatis]MDR6968759.1 hypothetical protein [Flavobacterium arsenatis]
MNTTPKQNSDDQEIDLSQISRKINQGFQNMGGFIFDCIQFVFKNAIIIAVLFIVGIGLGYFLDTNQKSYKHELIVIPNFGSADYLYGKVELINSKIKERDTVFLKGLGLKYPKKISKLEIQPIVDPYNFIRDREENFELLKLMAEDGSIDKVLTDKITSKNYNYHSITFSTKGKATDENTIQPLLNSLNDSEYFRLIQKNIVSNVKVKMEYNEQTLNQINAVLNSFANEVSRGSSNSNLVYYNENTQLNEVLQAKYNLVSEQGNRRIELVNYEKIIKDVSVIANIEKGSKNKLILPLLLIFIFVIGKLFFGFYKNQSAKFKERTVN